MIIENVILAESKEAEGHKIAGIQEVADETTLKLFLETAVDVLPVTLDHSESLISKIGIVGMITKDSLKIVGNKLLGTLKIADEAFTEKMFFVGKFLEELLAKSRSEINISLESQATFEFKDNLAYIRPTVTTCASLVAQGALTSELFRKYSSNTINNNIGDIKMSEEIKKEEVVVPVDAGCATTPEVKKPEEEKMETQVDAPAFDVQKAIGDLASKIDAIAAVLAQMTMPPAAIAVEDRKLAAVVEENKKVEIKLAADIPECNVEVAETDEQIMEKAKEHKYYKANASKVDAAATRLTKKLVVK